jgi:putative MATE family efflux protein
MAEETGALAQDRAAAERAQGEVRSQVLNLALPAVGEQLLNMLVGVVDTFLVGHLGAASLAGVGLANQIVMLSTVFFAAVATGTTALVARHTGAGEPKMANRIMHQSFLLGVSLALPLIVLLVAGASVAVRLMGAQADVLPLGTTYLRIVAPTMLAGALMFIGNASLRGAGDTRTPMNVMAVVNVINIAVAYTLINGLGPFPSLGVAGSAWGAALGRTAGCLLVLFILARGKAGLHFSLPAFRPDTIQIKRIVNVSLPAGMETLSMRLGQTLFAATVASLGTAAYAAHQVVMTSESISFMPGFGFGVASATLTGQWLGAKNPRRAEQSVRAAWRLAVMVMSGMGVLFFLFPGMFMRIFTNDPEVIAQGILPLRLIAFSQPLLATMMVLSSALRGAGDTRTPFVVTTLGIWGVRLPLATVLVRMTSIGLPAAWFTMVVDLTMRGIFFANRFRAGKWKTLRV